ncbi:MAG: 3-hydroxyacyl-CoA dehydrogenase NAD-binding domain-containing protein [Oscillospiraceae bacterium]|nr:3-hydroxyacyl-CoA dehydrogenase NAD-binding domain-containing protein [Oscillospiraceae bacterium]
MIRNITVVGAGTMGHGIAHVFSRHGYMVSLYEPFDDVRAAAMQKIREELQFMVDEEYITAEDMETGVKNIAMFSDLAEAARDADYVIEACPEDMEMKRKLFARLDKICPPHTVFATNTSSLKLGDMMAQLPPERQKLCMVCHWYNPAHLLPIAELSEFGNMDEDVFNDVYALYVKCEKQPIRILKDITGMVANRLLHAQAREAFHLMEIGAASPEDIDKAIKYGPCFRNATTGMLEVADMGGLDVWLAGEDNIFPALDNSSKACGAMRALVTAGNLGIKTGRGFFDYSEEKRGKAQTEFYKRLIIQLKASKNY